jgi:hypothetical protein
VGNAQLLQTENASVGQVINNTVSIT